MGRFSPVAVENSVKRGGWGGRYKGWNALRLPVTRDVPSGHSKWAENPVLHGECICVRTRPEHQ